MGRSFQVEDWIAAARRGDGAALAKLLATYHPALHGRAAALMDSRLKGRTSPEDVVQEVYLDVARRIDRFEDRDAESFLSWLHAILHQKVAEARRTAHRKVRDLNREMRVGDGMSSSSYWNLLENVYADSGTPSRVARRQEALSALSVSLAELSHPHREVIRLRFLEGLPVRDAAERLGRSEAAVVALTKRALAALREGMDELGEFTRGT